MSQTHFRRPFWGRIIRPVAFFLMVSLLIVTWGTFLNIKGGPNFAGLAGDVIGVVALMSAGMLAWGWWTKSDRWLTAGLSGCTAAWVGVITVIIMDYGWLTFGTLFGVCWVGISASTYLLERRGEPRGGPRG